MPAGLARVRRACQWVPIAKAMSLPCCCTYVCCKLMYGRCIGRGRSSIQAAAEQQVTAARAGSIASGSSKDGSLAGTSPSGSHISSQTIRTPRARASSWTMLLGTTTPYFACVLRTQNSRQQKKKKVPLSLFRQRPRNGMLATRMNARVNDVRVNGKGLWNSVFAIDVPFPYSHLILILFPSSQAWPRQHLGLNGKGLARTKEGHVL